MCGIAGYSLSPNTSLDRTLVAQTLLAGIAERGADAVGYAHRGRGVAGATVVKQRSGASQLLDRISVPAAATQLLIHVRDYTKGHPSIAANNHPVRHGPVVGIHNGIIVNDDAILGELECARAERGMTVDSEAIFALAAHSCGDARALEHLRGALATAWLDERAPDVIYLARGVARPLWLGVGRDATFFASTKRALEVLERYVRVKLRKREVHEGTMLVLRDGEVQRTRRFRPDHGFVEEDPLPAVRAPREAEVCMSALAALAAAAA
jgi:glucosamine 6-phosphate synthetase-like amidotransferase/phosphosugar isomerase protein